MADLWHSWGNSPKQKAREKEYNHAYYLRNKDKWRDKITDGSYTNTDGKTTHDWDWRPKPTYQDVREYKDYSNFKYGAGKYLGRTEKWRVGNTGISGYNEQYGFDAELRKAGLYDNDVVPKYQGTSKMSEHTLSTSAQRVPDSPISKIKKRVISLGQHFINNMFKFG